jgi:hypothetical protein
VVPPASFTVIRLRADIPGAWIVVCQTSIVFKLPSDPVLLMSMFLSIDVALSHWMAHVSSKIMSLARSIARQILFL